MHQMKYAIFLFALRFGGCSPGWTIFAHYLHNICTTFAQCLHNICTLFAKCLHNICKMFANYLHNIWWNIFPRFGGCSPGLTKIRTESWHRRSRQPIESFIKSKVQTKCFLYKSGAQIDRKGNFHLSTSLWFLHNNGKLAQQVATNWIFYQILTDKVFSKDQHIKFKSLDQNQISEIIAPCPVKSVWIGCKPIFRACKLVSWSGPTHNYIYLIRSGWVFSIQAGCQPQGERSEK